MIPSTPDEDLLYELLKELAARLSHALTEDGVRHGLIGGTALKIGYGLTRPSTDLDVKVEEPRFFTQYIERAFDAVTEWSYREPTDEEWNQGSEGIIVEHLATGQTFSTRIDFVPGPLHDTDSPTIDDRQIEEHHGVRMFGLADLAQYKLNALIGPTPRKRPRDVYDAAWLMENWPDAIAAATKRKLYQWHRSLTSSPALYAEWTNEFQTPDVGRHVTLETLMGCLAASFMAQSAAPKHDSTRRAAYQDVLDAPAHLVAEVLDGTLHTHPRPAMPHGLATLALGTDLSNPFQFGRGGPGGWWIAFEPELHLGEEIVVPDLAGWRRERMPEYPQTAYVTLAPDWVCEVLSASTRRLDLHQKRPLYAHEGVGHLWLVDPIDRTLEAFELHEGQWLLIAGAKDDDPVSIRPFDAITFNLGDLWP